MLFIGDIIKEWMCWDKEISLENTSQKKSDVAIFLLWEKSD